MESRLLSGFSKNSLGQPVGLAKTAHDHGISFWSRQNKNAAGRFRPRCAQTQVQRLMSVCKTSVPLSSAGNLIIGAETATARGSLFAGRDRVSYMLQQPGQHRIVGGHTDE